MKQLNEISQRSNLNNSEVKQDSERSQIFHVNNSDDKNSVVSFVRYLILRVVQ